jgi:hypothetical protein
MLMLAHGWEVSVALGYCKQVCDVKVANTGMPASQLQSEVLSVIVPIVRSREILVS